MSLYFFMTNTYRLVISALYAPLERQAAPIGAVAVLVWTAYHLTPPTKTIVKTVAQNVGVFVNDVGRFLEKLLVTIILEAHKSYTFQMYTLHYRL